jgi:tetratricopeptide (TPR) repeat protein
MANLHVEIFRPTDARYRLRLRDADGGLKDERDLDRAELERLLAASENLYAGGAESRAELGRGLYRWLDGPAAGWLRESCGESGGLTLHVTCDERLRHLPWELLQDEGVFLCAATGLVPVRRVPGRGGNGGGTPANRPLRVLFMAASPQDVRPVLAFEQEEARILDATRKAGLELVVEESGRLEGLREWIDGFPEGHFDVVHLSGHADVDGRRPIFLCEDERGRAHRATAADIAGVFADSGRFPRLLFLSGCRTGQAPAAGVLPSLCEALVKAGVPAVLGWALPVGDAAATLAAAEFYERLANGVPLDRALDRARRALYEKDLPDWPLLRLYADASPLAPLVTPRRTPGRVPFKPVEARQRFLDAGGKVEVCPRERFVGRRRALQYALRVLAALPGDADHAEGVLLHGMGGLGKSSLAARLCDRLPHHERWVWVGRLDETALRQTVYEALQDCSEFVEINRRGLALPAWLKALVETVLERRPVLFVFDDFEHNLRAGEQGGEWAAPEARRCLHALLEALHRAGSPSRVIVTSRYAFPLEHPERLAPLSLDGFRDADLRKKTERLECLREEAKTPPDLREAAVELGAGNPRLLERLDAALGAPGLDGAALLQRLRAVREEFREDIVLRALVDGLRAADRRGLALAALYRLPVPLAALAAPDPAAHPRAAVALGLAEENRLEADEVLYFVPELVAELLEGELDEATRRAAIDAAAEVLYRLWWTEAETVRWERVAEVRRLALLAGQAEAVARTTEWLAGRLLDAYEAGAARELCREALALGDDAMVWLNLGRAGQFLGDGGEAGGAYERALATLPRPEPGDARERDYATLLFHAADYAARSGKLELAEGRLREVADVYERLGDVRSKAVTLGQIADIWQARGQLDEALRIRLEECVPVYERLGDVREKAVTLGRIADILEARGQLDEALRILREDLLPTFERLGDVREKAVTLGRIADILEARGQLDEALRIRLEECVPVYERLGDVRSKAVTLGQIADIWQARGRLDEALRIRREEELPVYERLGDVRSKAVTLFQIAQVELEREQFPEAYGRLHEAYAICEKLQNPDGLAAVGEWYGQLLFHAGERERGLAVLETARDAAAKLGWDDDVRRLRDLIETLRNGPPPAPPEPPPRRGAGWLRRLWGRLGGKGGN